MWKPWQGVETLTHTETRCGNLDSHRNNVWRPWQGVETLTHIKTRCGKPWQGVETLTQLETMMIKIRYITIFFHFFRKEDLTTTHMNEDEFNLHKYKWYSLKYSECMTQDNDDKCYDISNMDFFFFDMLMHVYDSCSNPS